MGKRTPRGLRSTMREDHDHCTSKRDEEPEVGEGRRIDVVGQQVDREGFE